MQNQQFWHQRLLTNLLRIFFKLLYQPLAWAYDSVATLVSIGMWASWVASAIPYLRGSRILEIGHGPGHLLIALNRKQFSVVGLDNSRQMNRIADRRLRRKQIKPMLIQGEATSLPLAEGWFDSIVSTFPSEYIFDGHTLGEAFRILAPGGRFIIIPYAWITGDKIIHKAAAWLFRITGETPRLRYDPCKPLEGAGFSARIEYSILDTSKVMIIVAEKPPI